MYISWHRAVWHLWSRYIFVKSRKFGDLSEELDACLARHAHACARVTAARTARKIGGRRCRRERSRKKRGEKADPSVATTKGEEKEKQERKRAKGGPFVVGGYRENEARHRVPHGPFSRHGARRRPQQCGPRGELGPAARARARNRDNDRREPHTRLAHVRAARAVNTNRVFFILGATSLFLLLFFFFFFILLFRLLFLLLFPRRRSPPRVSVSFSRDSAATATGPARSRWLRTSAPLFFLLQ